MLSYYLSAPGLKWNAIVKMKKVVSISNRYSKANNKYLKSYDKKQESKHIIHIDTNNLHGYAMSKFLPTSGFKWIDPTEFDLIVQKDKFKKISSKR